MANHQELLVKTICEYLRSEYQLEFESNEPCDIDDAVKLAYWENRLDLVQILLQNGANPESLKAAIAQKAAFDQIKLVSVKTT